MKHLKETAKNYLNYQRSHMLFLKKKEIFVWNRFKCTMNNISKKLTTYRKNIETDNPNHSIFLILETLELHLLQID